MMKNLFDNHSHCQFSFDGKNTSIEKSSRSAFEKGLGGICFTDHNDIYVPMKPKLRTPMQMTSLTSKHSRQK